MTTKRMLTMMATLALGAVVTSSASLGQTAATTGGDDEMKMMALNGLRQADASVAVPQIEKLLASNSSIELKRRALSILAQDDTAQARDVLARFARGESNTSLQGEAIRQLGVMGGSEAQKTLADIYAASSDMGIKRMILRSFMVAGDKDRLLAAAKDEKNGDLRVEAVRQLGAMGASDALLQLYKTESTDEVKAQILRGLGICGNTEAISQIAQNDPSPTMRQAAVRAIGISDGGNSEATLTRLYSTEKDMNVRKEILRSFFIRQDAKGLIAVAKTETDPELRKYAVRQLSVMNSKEATDYLVELLNK